MFGASGCVEGVSKGNLLSVGCKATPDEGRLEGWVLLDICCGMLVPEGRLWHATTVCSYCATGTQ